MPYEVVSLTYKFINGPDAVYTKQDPNWATAFADWLAGKPPSMLRKVLSVSAETASVATPAPYYPVDVVQSQPVYGTVPIIAPSPEAAVKIAEAMMDQGDLDLETPDVDWHDPSDFEMKVVDTLPNALVYEADLPVTDAILQAMDKALNRKHQASGETLFDEEVTFADGNRMAIQVIESGDSAGKATAWSQGVLFSPEGQELGMTSPCDFLDGEFVVHTDDGTKVYKTNVIRGV